MKKLLILSICLVIMASFFTSCNNHMNTRRSKSDTTTHIRTRKVLVTPQVIASLPDAIVRQAAYINSEDVFFSGVDPKGNVTVNNGEIQVTKENLNLVATLHKDTKGAFDTFYYAHGSLDAIKAYYIIPGMEKHNIVYYWDNHGFKCRDYKIDKMVGLQYVRTTSNNYLYMIITEVWNERTGRFEIVSPFQSGSLESNQGETKTSQESGKYD